MNRQQVIQKIEDTRIIPVIRAKSAAGAARLIEAIGAGGIDVFEITMTVPDAVRLIEKLTNELGDRALIGAGTVLSPEQAAECIAAGARFVISPALDARTIAACRKKDIAVMPGALTPTEVVAAWNEGADFVKVFPAGALGGAGYIRSLKAPLPGIKLIPTGGVSLENAAEHIKAGASAVGIGTDLADESFLLLPEGETMIKEKSRRVLGSINNA